MKLLDLFCGAGGAAMGYSQAGFDEIVGVDIMPQPNYPFRFIQADALAFLDAMIDTTEDCGYDLIHASPPCQAYSVATADAARHPDLIAPVREALQIIGLPYAIENVPGAPLSSTLRLCGSMFGLNVQRHRYFEITFPAWSLSCNHREWEGGRPVLVAGHLGGRPDLAHHRPMRSFDQARELMGMPWAQTLREVTEAIPPAYTKFIGEQFISQHAVTSSTTIATNGST